MPRRRRSHRVSVYRPLKTAKYSNETFVFTQGFQYAQNSQVLVVVSSATPVLGTRKAKNFTVNFLTDSTIPILFALIYVPEGTQPNLITWGSDITGGAVQANAMYNPNQNVILSGISAGFNQGTVRLKTRLARNLNSGDYLLLAIRPMAEFTGTVLFVGSVNYAISY